MIDEWGKGAKYWDRAWNPMIGCRKCSEGCQNCYAARMAEKLVELQDENGGFEPHPHKNLPEPPKSGVVFVGNMTDIFGEWNDEKDIGDWISRLSPDAQNLILTKRPQIMGDGMCMSPFVHFGMTAENQLRYNERRPQFCRFCQAGKPWLSAEPLLGPIDLFANSNAKQFRKLFKWVVVGAESGPNRRPCRLGWVRQIVNQCREANVKVFVKQLDLDGKLEKDIAKFPEDLQIRQVPWVK